MYDIRDDVDTITVEHIAEKVVTAASPHRCDTVDSRCLTPIESGDRYRQITSKVDGEIVTCRFHLGCVPQ